MLKKILSNTIVRLILAVLIGLLVGLAVNESVLKAVMIVKQITGQIIFFLVPLIIRGAFYRPLEKQRIQSLIIRF